ncbi:MAG: hypothetical protein DLM62_03775, partial [Pseudonocardiales bacterium]
REGGPAAGIVITHPASWGAYKTRIIAQALREAEVPEVTFRTEPEAAAASYALQERIEAGSAIAVYDLGGGTFDAAVVRKTGTTTFSVLGHPQGLEQLGGVDFDDAVFNHVLTAVPALAELDPDDPATLEATAALRRECTAAKEALSVDTEVTIPVLAPGIRTQVRLIRAEFEDMIRSQVAETVEALRRTLRSAGLEPQGLDAVLLVGGSSRVPLVAQLVSAELGRPVSVDSDPKAAIALGAAFSGLPAGAADSAPSNTADAEVPAVASTPAAGTEVPTTAPILIPQRPALTSTPLDIEVAQPLWRRVGSQRGIRVAAALLAALVLAGGAALLLASGNSPAAPAQVGSPATATSVTTPPPAPSTGNGSDATRSNGGAAAPAPVAPHNTRPGLPAPRPIISTTASVPTSSAIPTSAAAIPTTAPTSAPVSTSAGPRSSTSVPPTATTPSSPHAS